jgi:hypothetical protein
VSKRSVIVNRELDMEQVALALARNQVGPKLPVLEVLATENVPEQLVETYLNDPTFKTKVNRMAQELIESGFGFSAKSRVLAEDLLKTTYAMARDEDIPAATRLKAIENLVSWGDLEPKKSEPGAAGKGGFTINIVVPTQIRQDAVAEAVQDTIATSQLAARAPVTIDMPADYVPDEDAGYEEDTPDE